ncbi:Hypothetical predicted protein [Pelobates cultripes]|uniref:KRAB domain-containing protein n=1 Tax=Pelobates cultripes TaxID=61616 RepID=A0AAD1T7U6_PELCU|nr:Hypothetical predicted protein [Pelobates cultripes]
MKENSFLLSSRDLVQEHSVRECLTGSTIMQNYRSKMAKNMLSLTLEIICLLTGEDYMIVKKYGEHVTHNSPNILEGSCRTQSPNMVPPSSSLIRERNNEKKILELSNQIIQLLTGEVSMWCEDVTVHLSMEEWEYLGGHLDHYKDVIGRMIVYC